MSRNPYLASHYSRSTRTPKTSAYSGGIRSAAVSRSRSSAALGAGYSSYNSYSSAAGCAPLASRWQRSTSSTRLGRYANDQPSRAANDSDTSKQSSPPENRRKELPSSSVDSSQSSLARSYSTQDLSNSLHDSDSETSKDSSVICRDSSSCMQPRHNPFECI